MVGPHWCNSAKLANEFALEEALRRNGVPDDYLGQKSSEIWVRFGSDKYG